MSAAVVWTGLRDVDAVQGEGRGVPVHAALLEPSEPGFTGRQPTEHAYVLEEKQGRMFTLIKDESRQGSHLAATLRGMTTVTLVHCS